MSLHVTDEEGSNDINMAELTRRNSYLPGVTRNGLECCTAIHTWCDTQKKLMLNSIDGSLHSLAESKNEASTKYATGNTLEHNNSYFSRRKSAIETMFHSHVLIMDNFATKAFGSNKQVDPKGFLGKDYTPEREEEMNKENIYFDNRSQKFAKVIHKLVTNNPDVLFVLRPHPISGITRWIESLGEHRNLFVLYKDSADPWILSSTTVIHAGCTTGIQSILCGKKTIDILKLIEKESIQTISSTISEKAESYEHLEHLIRMNIKQGSGDESPSSKKNDDRTIVGEGLERYKQNYKKTLENPNIIDGVNNRLASGLGFSNKSSMLEIVEEAIKIKTNRIGSVKVDPLEEAERVLKRLVENKMIALPQSKVSYINEHEIGNRIRDAASVFNVKVPKWRYLVSKRCLVIAGNT